MKTITDFLKKNIILVLILTILGCGVEFPNPSKKNSPDPAPYSPTTDSGGFVTRIINGYTSESGATARFTVKLNKYPSAEVTIAISSGDITEGSVSPLDMTFTPFNWDIEQEVTVTGVDDDILDGDIQYSVIIGPAVSIDPEFDGVDPNDLWITNLDNETQ
ncbi:MAG: hypothetical protein OEY59_02245 [Deltaproteobacteria bacterium]|nr:hypothetical protein [Deltaproteobacteria bacterium]